MATKQQPQTAKKKKSKAHLRLLKGRGQAHIKSTYNNTMVTITDQNGSTICWGTAGKAGFKSAKKSTPYAASVVIKSIVQPAKEAGVKELDVFVKGVGPARESAIRALAANGFQISTIKDVTPVPHNGCRPKKPRRV